MSEIHVSCNDQVLKITSAPTIASGGVNETKVVFSFCEKWDGFVKTAVFYVDEDNPYSAILDENDTCILPWEVYSDSGTFYITVFGDKDGTRRTASVVKYKARKGVIPGGTTPSDPTPDVYSQIIALLGGGNKAVSYEKQTLTGEEKEQARENIGAASAVSFLDRFPDTGYVAIYDGSRRYELMAHGDILRLYNTETRKQVRLLSRDNLPEIVEEASAGKLLYTEQELNNEEKAQARKNIGVEEAVLGILVDFGIAPVLLDENGAVLTDGDDAVLVNK